MDKKKAMSAIDALEEAMPILRSFVRRHGEVEIATWDPKAVVFDKGNPKSGMVPDGKVTYVNSVKAFKDAVAAWKRSKGHWDFLKYDSAVCSCCGDVLHTPFDSTAEALEKWKELPHYCSTCGARMEYKKPKVRLHGKDNRKGSRK